MKLLKYAVKTNNDDGELNLAVVPPSSLVKQRSEFYRAKVYADALKNGAMMRPQMEKYLKDANLWDDARQAEFDRLRKSLLEGELLIEKKRHPDGSPVKLSEAKAIAIKMSEDRGSLQDLLSVKNSVDANTADALAHNAQFSFLVAACTVYDDGEYEGQLYFKNADDYVERSSEQAAYDAATKLSEIMYGSSQEYLDKLPENSFLKKYKFVDENYNLIDENGNKVDKNGRRIDDENFYINDSGERVDEDGNLVDKDGRYISDDNAYFVDDEGNPI